MAPPRCSRPLNWPEGRLIGTCMPRHRHQEWIKFLKLIDQQTPSDLDLHVIVDNYATHKHAKVKSWLKRHPRFHMHFIPTSSSWLNLIERWFRNLTDKQLRRGAYISVQQLIATITAFIDAHNADAKRSRGPPGFKTSSQKSAEHAPHSIRCHLRETLHYKLG